MSGQQLVGTRWYGVVPSFSRPGLTPELDSAACCPWLKSKDEEESGRQASKTCQDIEHQAPALHDIEIAWPLCLAGLFTHMDCHSHSMALHSIDIA